MKIHFTTKQNYRGNSSRCHALPPPPNSTPPPFPFLARPSSRRSVMFSTCPICLIGRLPAYDRYFAYNMRYGMDEYEKEMEPVKAALFRNHIMDGDQVLDLGIGTGPNLPYLKDRNIQVTGLDPNRAMQSYAQRNAIKANVPLSLLVGSGEAMPFDDASFDVILSTLVLCSVPEPQRVLRECARVLKPQGKLLFIEHVAAPAWTRKRVAQELFNPAQILLADNCHLTRDTEGEFRRAEGFDVINMDRYEVKGVGLIAPHISGVMRRIV